MDKIVHFETLKFHDGIWRAQEQRFLTYQQIISKGQTSSTHQFLDGK